MIEYEINSKRNTWEQIKSLPQYKDLFVSIVKKNIVAQYQRTYLGVVWLFLQPIVMSILFYTIIKYRVNVSVENYIVFLYAGFILWNVFSGSLYGAANGLIFNAGIIKKVYFPRMLVPLSYVVARIFDFCILFVSLVLLLLFKQMDINWLKFIPFSILAFLIIFITVSGLGLTASAINIKYRDLQRILPFFLQILLFISPIIYPLRFLANPTLERVLIFNPIAGAVNIFRAGIFDTPIGIHMVLLYFGIASICFFIGIIVFQSQEKTIIDNI